MTRLERRATVLVAAILVLRMASLFLVLPVLAPYAQGLAGATGLLVGLSVGAYGLTQALLQIPFGWLSDRIGRRPVIAIGLLLFALGSVLAARAQSAEALVVARLLQGSGAIASAATALLADLTRDVVRTTAMAVVGASIGGAFLLALVAGPVLVGIAGVPGLFVIAAGAAGLALCLLLAVPTGRTVPAPAPDAAAAGGRLWPLALAVFLLHAMMSALFVAVPLRLLADGWALDTHWLVYLPVMALALAPVFWLIRWVEDGERLGLAFLLSAAALLAAGVLLGIQAIPVAAGLWLFFAGFNWLEASLPSLVSRRASGPRRGLALGAFASSQFLGAFAGGAAAGLALASGGTPAVFAAIAGLAALWLLGCVVLKPARSA